MVKMKNTEQVVTEELNKKAEGISEAKADAIEKQDGEITVACSIPMGIKLPTKSGLVLLKGIPMSQIVSARDGGFLPAGKYGLTKITLAQWEEIKARYGSCDFMNNGAIIANAEHKSVVDEAVEKSELKSGFEQADPKKGRTVKAEG